MHHETCTCGGVTCGLSFGFDACVTCGLQTIQTMPTIQISAPTQIIPAIQPPAPGQHGWSLEPRGRGIAGIAAGAMWQHLRRQRGPWRS